MYTASSRALLALFQGQPSGDGDREYPRAAGPTLIKVRDAVDDIEEVMAQLDETPEGRQANSWLKRRRNKGPLGFDADRRKVVLEGRDCCMTLARGLDRILHRLRLPSEHICPGCGTTWRVEMHVREQRQHV